MGTHCFKKLLGTLLMGTAFSLAGTAPALADNPADNFQLDGDILSSTGGPAGKPDWSDIFTGLAPSAGATAKSPLPAGFTSASFLVDFFPATTADNSLYATGSKDTLNITPGWQCKKTNNVNDKVDINNAYAVAYTKTVGTSDGKPHLFVYFGLDVASNDGTKDVGFWFLKDPTVSCPAGNGTTSFTGTHTDGDILIVSEFTNGGRVSTINAYRWNGGADGSLGPNPVASGGECDGTAFDVCAKVNGAVLNGDGNTPDVPWLVKTKQSNPSSTDYTSSKDLDIGEFFEGGIDLTSAGISGCFNRYLADTRSSTSLGATIFDFTLGNFSNCSIGATKTCSAASVNSDFTTFTSPFTVTITNDSAAGTVYDASFKETFTFGQTGETCKISSVTGTGTAVVDASVVNTQLESGNLVKVASSLGPNDSVIVGVSCTGALNSFQDSIHAVAGSSAGLSDIQKDAVVSSASAAACQATVQADLEITKVCKGMQLVAGSNSLIALKANVEVTVTNPSTSNQLVTINTPTDTKVSSFTQVDCSTLTALQTPDLVLSPNETACFTGSYNPTNTDLANPPSTAAFSDGASVTGTGSIKGTFTAGPAQATCYLCDADVDGIPDVIDCLTDSQCGKTPQ
ncbi:hypothetical protein [Pseudogulbenkiania ferrooxidans]|uniref:Uncharacterized protein n=1 Tax=Pseudogulbenkiania ferrooxidans 2002 TaxID=279714 RepID=B9Z6B3_9NEIS|nr:hypothetical protein [Pseudogulbenkiania ferrooxidans]EEG07757.1 hypothetical protein FuraDRAFT_3080 [Pseudogulbenkiania ferrooxidans 2002]